MMEEEEHEQEEETSTMTEVVSFIVQNMLEKEQCKGVETLELADLGEKPSRILAVPSNDEDNQETKHDDEITERPRKRPKKDSNDGDASTKELHCLVPSLGDKLLVFIASHLDPVDMESFLLCGSRNVLRALTIHDRNRCRLDALFQWFSIRKVVADQLQHVGYNWNVLVKYLTFACRRLRLTTYGGMYKVPRLHRALWAEDFVRRLTFQVTCDGLAYDIGAMYFAHNDEINTNSTRAPKMPKLFQEPKGDLHSVAKGGCIKIRFEDSAFFGDEVNRRELQLNRQQNETDEDNDDEESKFQDWFEEYIDDESPTDEIHQLCIALQSWSPLIWMIEDMASETELKGFKIEGDADQPYITPIWKHYFHSKSDWEDYEGTDRDHCPVASTVHMFLDHKEQLKDNDTGELLCRVAWLITHGIVIFEKDVLAQLDVKVTNLPSKYRNAKVFYQHARVGAYSLASAKDYVT